jgi:hypothetical protein
VIIARTHVIWCIRDFSNFHAVSKCSKVSTRPRKA